MLCEVAAFFKDPTNKQLLLLSVVPVPISDVILRLIASSYF